MTLRLSDKAEEDLIKIFLDGIECFGLAKAELYRDKIKNSLAIINENPETARIRTEITPPVRVHPVGMHIIIYRVDDIGDVVVLRVRSAREDWIADPEGA